MAAKKSKIATLVPAATLVASSGKAMTAMTASARSLRWLSTGVALITFALASATARADVVGDWNVVAFDTFKAANIAGNPQVRALAIMHVAMSDAVNTVQNRYTRHALKVALDPSASADAAAIAAARGVLVAIAPTQKAKVDAAYIAALGPLPDGAAKGAGIAIGEQAAAAPQAAIFGSVVAGVFEAVFGPGAGPALVVTDSADPKLTRSFDSFAAIVEETRLVRIWGGIHFRHSLEVSDAMGRQIASYIVANSLRPVR